ncbi:phosphoglycerol geranylgeranyltransferase [Natronomonas salsuginis]|jgi:phosphoglycerol geranylgeranyltransferase|uniref:Geranylgeranylglyceryl phosphate synthase n=1 Tax=Natronomonas salsuginis TaxID=2217661 RepID=A0A4U5J825_9EURY|nr:putative phosphoglycerol geranylgeranyltransferase [Natronomonas salsuginis]TKR24834.1 putative phosphoglycerol geranylgeranyltransferase [Natronomonas salsuginis]
MSAPWAAWDHIVKIDPDKTLVEGETFEDVCATGTDALEIGGTTGMTEEKMARVVEATTAYDVPVYIEPSNVGSVVHRDGLDGYFVPIVLNAGDPFWVTGAHKEWARLDSEIDWEATFPEAYIVLNPDSSVATYTEADCNLDVDEVAAYAEVAEQMLGQRIIYIEYSGTFGDPDVVRAAADAVEDAATFYGGGVDDYESAYEMGRHADTVIVGDLVHDEGVEAVEETVAGAKDAKSEPIEGV